MRIGPVLNRPALPLAIGVGLTLACQPESPKSPDGIWLTEIGSGPLTVVVLHGGPALTHRYLRPEWDVLADEARLIYYDQRGCGRSERTDSVSWERHVADLDSIVASRDDSPIMLAGSSWGSILALLYAYEHQEGISGLILSGVPDLERLLQSPKKPLYPRVIRRAERGRKWSGSCPGQWILKPVFEVVWAMTDSIVIYKDSTVSYKTDSTGAAMRLSTRRRPPPAVRDSAEIAADTVYTPPQLAARMGMSCPRTANAIGWSVHETAPTLDSLSAIGVPVLIVRGEEITSVGDGSAQLAEVLPNARVETLEDAGHDPWFEQPEQFFELVRDFLSAAAKAGGSL